MRMLTRSHSDFAAFIESQKSPLADYRIEAGVMVYVPFCLGPGTQPYFACGKAFEMLHETDPKKRHTVTIMLSCVNGGTDPEFHFVCGDTYLCGTNNGGVAEADARIEKALAQAGLPGKASLRKLMKDSHDSFDPDSGCGFWKGIKKTPGGPGCKHVAGLFQQLSDKGEVEKVLAEIELGYSNALAGKKRRAKTAEDECEVLLKKLQKLGGPSRKIKCPIRIEGPKGLGKTIAARLLGEAGFDHFLEVGGCNGMEQCDLLGGHINVGGGATIWMDGPLTEAYRLAAGGKKVLLLVDEYLRIPRRERGIFLTALSPYDGCYRLRTGRPLPRGDGTASTEFLLAPVENLTIIGTTNSGSDYDVDDDDPAEGERWLTLLHDPGVGFVESVLKKAVAKRGFSEKLVAKLVRFRSNCEKLKADRNCKDVPSPRVLERAVNLAEDEAEVADQVELLFPALVGRAPDGRAIKEQWEAIELAHAKAFAA